MRLSTIAILFMFGMLAITTINAIKSKPLVDESALIIQAQNLYQSSVMSGEPPSTKAEFDEFCPYLPFRFSFNVVYGPARQPGEIGYESFIDPQGVPTCRVTARGNSDIVFDTRSFQ